MTGGWFLLGSLLFVLALIAYLMVTEDGEEDDLFYDWDDEDDEF